ncbi:MAG TPA: T9SS type A sorting domain-containing protein [Saprospiraceae bacterium]|nr:T9SS type A sorting domain-containing protein [Saprospiraceae bacterium]
MKPIYFLALCLLSGFSAYSQYGLERIIVEKYYVSDANDKTVDGDGGVLPLNSVTYRVFVDMLPGYIFQAAYGTPEHELKIATSTTFFNNQDRGARFPTYSRNQAQNNTVMLDSWLSAGGALKDHAGVLKEMDNGENTIENADGVLQNEHAEAGIPLTQEDGAIAATVEPVTVVGFFDADLTMLDDINAATGSTSIITHDGAWSSLNGSRGQDTTQNIVLIGQFTTDGVFEFELNLQIRNQQTLAVENYVARNPLGAEILFDDLIHIDSLGFMSSIAFDSPLHDHVKVYPNPTSGNVTIELNNDIELNSSNIQFILSSLDGSMLKTGKITDKLTSLDMTQFLPGVYLISLGLIDGSRFSTKIIRTQ